jgi:hypothetical protein
MVHAALAPGRDLVRRTGRGRHLYATVRIAGQRDCCPDGLTVSVIAISRLSGYINSGYGFRYRVSSPVSETETRRELTGVGRLAVMTAMIDRSRCSPNLGASWIAETASNLAERNARFRVEFFCGLCRPAGLLSLWFGRSLSDTRRQNNLASLSGAQLQERNRCLSIAGPCSSMPLRFLPQP